MKKRLIGILASSLLICGLVSAQRKRDATLTDITVQQPQYQVIPQAESDRIATQEEAMRDIRQRFENIEQALKEIKADLKVLNDANVLVQFFFGVAKFLIPGLIITAFGVWLTRTWNNKTPARRARSSP